MLGDFIYSEEMENPAYAAGTPAKAEKTAKRFLLFAVIFIGLGLIWILAISPCMVPVRADVRSFPGLDRKEAMAVAGIGSRTTFVSVNAGEAELRLAGHHLVDSAKVVKRFPDRLMIYLEPRKAVAVAFARVNGRTQPVYFDRHGVAFRIGGGAANAGADAPPSWLPVVSGIFDANQQIWPGMRLSAAVLPLFSRIGSISDDDPNIWKAISEIKIAKKQNDLYDLVLFPLHHPIRLRMGSDITKDSIYYALLMFDVCRQFGNNVPEEIDVRSGIGVFNTKEARFGE
ncbi:MAG: FtsQ-type POTRA domain-containing protein [Treponema sp.]|nr:FtsQ-type POTRA domain-containing protein [Treponema sp.]